MLRNSNNNQLFRMNLSPPSNSNSSNSMLIPESRTIPEPNRLSMTNLEAPKKEMKWAGPTWLILHTLAEKIDESNFNNIRVELLNTVYTICTILPCPLCAAHAKKYLDGVNFDTIKNKENLKYLLFEFHNSVSKEKNLPLYDYAKIDVYKTANTIVVIQNFMFHFSKKSGSIRLISDDLHRARTIIILKTWFNDNIKYFSK